MICIASNCQRFIIKHNPVLAILATSFAIYLSGDRVKDCLEYQRQAISSGQWWRLLSAHLVHLNLTHLLMNSAALIVIWGLVSPATSNTRCWTIIAISMLGISLSLILWNPNLVWYVGLSGVLHGLVVAAIYSLLKQNHRIFAILLFSGLCLKLVTEQRYGSSMSVTASIIGGPVIVDAHFYGAIIGLIVVAVIGMIDRQHRRRN